MSWRWHNIRCGYCPHPRTPGALALSLDRERDLKNGNGDGIKKITNAENDSLKSRTTPKEKTCRLIRLTHSLRTCSLCKTLAKRRKSPMFAGKPRNTPG